jgi:hypothetical protein
MRVIINNPGHDSETFSIDDRSRTRLNFTNCFDATILYPEGPGESRAASPINNYNVIDTHIQHKLP